MVAVALIRATSYSANHPADHAPWDVLYVAAGAIAFVLLVVLAAAWMNAREGHRT